MYKREESKFILVSDGVYVNVAAISIVEFRPANELGGSVAMISTVDGRVFTNVEPNRVARAMGISRW